MRTIHMLKNKREDAHPPLVFVHFVCIRKLPSAWDDLGPVKEVPPNQPLYCVQQLVCDAERF